MSLSDTTIDFCNAFPSVIRSDVEVVLDCVPPSPWPPFESIGPVQIDGEQLQIFFRFSSSEPDLSSVQFFNERQRLILNAIYTRHLDGFIRERHVRPLLTSDEPWIPPFVVQLLGEYVIEIIQLLDDHRAVFIGPSYVSFARQNRAFFQLLRQRILSYWNCYFRHRFQSRDDYPAFRILKLMEAAV